MNKVIVPSVETTNDFILIKIPRNLISEPLYPEKVSLLERGLRESMKEALADGLVGPFRSGKAFLCALKKPAK